MSLAPQFCVGAFLVSAMASVAEAPAPPEAAAPEKWEALAAYQRRLAAGTAAGGEGLAAFPEPTAAAPFAAVDGAAAGAADAPVKVNVSAVNFQGCSAPGAEQFAFCDMSLSTEERVEDLLTRFTLEEKLGMISPNPTLGSTCQGYTWNGTSLGDSPFLKQVITYIWLNEANTNVQSACWKGWDGKANKCSTNLPGPNCVASTWNRTVFHQKGVIISTEQRALRLVGGTNHVGKAPMSVSGFGPNMNVQRDPRFGRNTELPSEDPFLTGIYAAGMISGAVEEDQGVPRMLMYMKHFGEHCHLSCGRFDQPDSSVYCAPFADAYGVNQTKPSEFARYNISAYDFWDSFLPAYRMGMHAGAYGVMCAHIAPNGQNACSNKWLLDTLRSWGPVGEKALVATDCGEIGIMGCEYSNGLSPDVTTVI